MNLLLAVEAVCIAALRFSLVLLPLAWMVAAPRTAQAQATTDPSPSPALSAVSPPAAPQAFVPGEIIVGFRTVRAADVAQQSLLAAQAEVVTTIDLRSTAGDAAAPVGQLWRVPVGEEQAIIATLAVDPNIVFAEPNWLVYTAQEPAAAAAAAAITVDRETPQTVNDPLYAAHQWNLQRSNFSRAWQQVAVSAPGAQPMQVAVIDTGIDLNHPEFAGRILPGFNYVEDGAPPMDDNGHGTHVAGLIAARADNGVGIAGGALPVVLDPRRALDSNGSGNIVDVVTAIRDAADNGARVINLSIQSPNYSSALAAAVQYAQSRGALLVAAAGNAPTCGFVCYPAKLPGVVAVAAVTIDRTPAYYSAQGADLDLAAGGGDPASPVLSTWPASTATLAHCGAANLIQAGGAWYCQIFGTSMAAPQVSSAAALLLAMRPTLTAGQVAEILRDTAQPLAGVSADRVGAGLLDAGAAVRQIVASELRLSQRALNYVVPFGSKPFTVTLVLSNPSLDPIAVAGTLVKSGSWVAGVSFGGANFATSVYDGQPAYVALRFTPTGLITGTYSGELVLDAAYSDGTHSALRVPVAIHVGALKRKTYLPLLRDGSLETASAPRFTWETGSNEVGYTLGNSGRAEIVLPFAFPALGPNGTASATYSRAIIAADGYVLFSANPGAIVAVPALNSCLPQLPQPLQVVWGWWTDLNTGAPGAEVVTFRPAADRFVIEYRNVASGASVPGSYRVTFQIVLFANGNVQLNYLQAPPVTGQTIQQAYPRTTVGVQGPVGLFRNQVACITATGAGNGALPTTRQSILIKRQEVY